MKLKDTGNLKRIYLLVQIILIAALVYLSVFLLSWRHAQKTTQQLLENLNKVSQLVISQVQTTQMPIEEFSSENYVVFVIDVAEGRPIWQQGARKEAAQKLWQSHYTKLIYQMQKQDHGWAYYPEAGRWNFTRAQRVIRFQPLEGINWIVAVETEVPSKLALMNDLFSAGTGMAILFYLFLGVGASWYALSRFSALYKKSVSDSLEKSMISLNNEDFWNQPVQSSLAPPEAADDKGQTRSPKPSFTYPEKKEQAKMPKPSVPEATEAPKDQQGGPAKEISPNETREKSEIDDLTLDVTGIKSPLLKKIIKDIRRR